MAVAQLEALRELKASAQRVGIRHAQEAGVPLKDANGAAVMSPLLTYVQAALMARPAALTEQATLDDLQKPYVVIASPTAPQFSDKAILLRYSQAVGQAVQAFRPQLTQQPGATVQQAVPPNEPKGENALPNPSIPKQQKAPAPKRRGPKLS